MRVKIIFVLLALSFLVLVSCSKTDLGTVKSDEEAPALDTFCERLSKCEEALMNIQTSDTGDVYNLAILGKDREKCVFGLTLQKAQTAELKKLEKLNVVCDQTWDVKFASIANFNGEKCTSYVNTFLVNLVTHTANPQSNLCYGPLRDKILGK